jgi:MOB kinase activator 1
MQGMQLKRHIDATLGSGNVLEAVCLPPGEDLHEWVAVNTVDFYNAISVFYSTLEEVCTDKTCEVMSAGSKVWEGTQVRKCMCPYPALLCIEVWQCHPAVAPLPPSHYV